jgi:class 3 adenylate cyclase
MSGIAHWLASHGLEKYAGVFTAAEIDLETVRELTAADLEELGIPLGPRKKLLKAISALRDNFNTSTITRRPGKPSLESTLAVRSEAERRQLTVLFADMVGSTALSHGMDPEELREIIRGFQDSVAGAIARFDGYVAKFMGDGLLAYFGWPRAHEDDAERAVRAGLGLIEATRLLKHPQEVRVGIATGLVVVGEVVGSGGASEEAAIGETLNLAARLQTEALPGSVILDPKTRALLGNLFELESLGHRFLKGFSDPIEAWRVLAETRSDSRFEAVRTRGLSRLIGRDQDLGLLLARWEQAKAGEGQTVLLRADAGVGKSRIVAELRKRVDAPKVRSVRYQCSAHHISSALYPIVRHLEREARIVPADTPEVRRLKLAEFLPACSDRSLSLLGALLSIPATEKSPAPQMTPQEQKIETLRLLCDLLTGLTEPPRVFRRLFRLSHAAIAGWSSVA